jgi:UDP-N-acetylglucosamine 2-epimerase (non-hydrolysing)
LAGFDIRCDVELTPLPSLANLAASCRNLEARLQQLILQIEPSVVLVQGDTLTAYAAARAGHAAGFPVAHIEAGLRTDTAADPFPEELFRRRIARHANVHFAPCKSAVQNLELEGIDPARIHRVGNTGIDSLRALLDEHDYRPKGAIARTNVLVTLHRRENLDGNADILCDALIELISRKPELKVVFPVHPNPRSALRIRRRLGGHPSFRLVEPMRYPDFINVAANAALLISDSGGLQEEAPHLGVPLLVPRLNTERPEGIATGFVRLVAVETGAIVRAAFEMLAMPPAQPLAFDDNAPFGAGDSAMRIIAVLETMELASPKSKSAEAEPMTCLPRLAEAGAS